MARAAAELMTRLELPHARALRRHLSLLREPRAGMSKRHRRPVIEAVVEAASADVINLHQRRRKGRCGARVMMFNATASALDHLWHTPRPPLPPMPPASLPAAAVAVGRHAAAAIKASSLATSSLATSSLAALPLRLVNCSRSPLHAPWQTWRLSVERGEPKGGQPCTGLCLAHRFSLEAAPSLCLSLGTTRTPRNPYQTLAQLEACATPAASAAALRARLHFHSKLATIKTTHRVSDFRRKLPEHSLTCGFWPGGGVGGRAADLAGGHAPAPRTCATHLRLAPAPRTR